jgi:hypothetical protein
MTPSLASARRAAGESSLLLFLIVSWWHVTQCRRSNEGWRHSRHDLPRVLSLLCCSLRKWASESFPNEQRQLLTLELSTWLHELTQRGLHRGFLSLPSHTLALINIPGRCEMCFKYQRCRECDYFQRRDWLPDHISNDRTIAAGWDENKYWREEALHLSWSNFK